MEVKAIICILVLAIFVAAYGLNPLTELKEAAAEKVLKNLTGSEHVSYEIGEESITYTAVDEDGNITGGSTTPIEDPKSIEAFGYLIAMPDGLSNGAVHRVENSSPKEVIITFDVDNTSAEQFFNDLHPELLSHGFVFDDIYQLGIDHPYTSEESFAPFLNYSHPDGQKFSILWQDFIVIIYLTESPI